MANEITISSSVTVSKGDFRDTFQPGSLQVDQTAIGVASGVWIVGNAAEEDLTLVDITTEGYAVFRNVDAANYVDFGPKSGAAMVPFVRLEAGEYAVLRLVPGVTIRGQANTAPVKLQYKVWEN